MIKFNTEARDGLKRGVDQLVDAVKVTLGAKGRNVAIQNVLGGVSLTKDGVTVANAIIPTDRVEAMGAQVIREVANKTAEEAGDGTTTASLLAQAIFTPGLEAISPKRHWLLKKLLGEKKVNPLDIKQGIDLATAIVVKSIKDQAECVKGNFERIAQIGTISANNQRDIGELIAGAMKDVGEFGVIKLEDSDSNKTYVDFVQGLKFDRGLMSPYFVTNHEKLETSFEDPLVLIYDKQLGDFNHILPLMNQISEARRSVVIIAEDISPDVLTHLVVNNKQGIISVATVKTPSYGDDKMGSLTDMAALLNTKVYMAGNVDELKEATLEDLGTCEKIVMDRFSTTIIGGTGNIDSRIKTLKLEIETAENDHQKDKLVERLAKLSGGVAILYVGGNSEVERKEKRDRVEDAKFACIAAVEEGIVVGGGVTYIRALSALDNVRGVNEDQNIGINILRQALKKPLFQISSNCGLDGDAIVKQVIEMKGDIGYNAKDDIFEDLKEKGIIDPAKVTRLALENASSVAGMLLTTECVITND